MISAKTDKSLRDELVGIEQAGNAKRETRLHSPQGARVAVGGGEAVNFCANDYLGLANDPSVLRAAHDAIDRWGFGTASVRFIVGTQLIHRELEEELSGFLHTDDTILFGSCFDANTGLFEVLLGDGDVVVSDELNHASIIDGIRLCKARVLRYRNQDLADLERCLIEASGARRILVVTDGVFSMDGYIAPLREICDLAEAHGALVMVDDSHAVGFVGPTGRGTPELFDVADRVDLVTGTLGKALGGASGGYVSGRRPIVDLLRQRARPYLFSNSVPPVVVATTLAVLDLIRGDDSRREALWRNTSLFRDLLDASGLSALPGEHPIVPVMLGDARIANAAASGLRDRGVHVVAFSHPVVPVGKSRIRIQVSASHDERDIRRAVTALSEVTRVLGLPGDEGGGR